jgi:predicted nucleic acid-binding protein
MEWISNSEPLLLKAADYKAHFPLSMADAWIAACASENGAVLLHKDPEFAPLPVAQELLPLKDKQAQ